VFSGAWLVADSGGMTGGDDSAGSEAGPVWRWDVALSFAGAQRGYVGQVAAALKKLGVRCFYDADEQVRLWGMHLAEELPRIYARESAAVVVFISADYARGDWTRLERRAAFSRAVAGAGVYVLPARFDDSHLPGLLPDVVTVDLRRYTPEQFAGLIAEKVAGLAGRQPGGTPAGTGPAAGRLLAQVTDPFALEVHRPVRPEDAPAGQPELPAYMPRGHDQVLAQVVRAAAGGRSGVAVLVGGSSTGKTRACWEALDLLRDDPEPWRLWHPIDPSRPEAALAGLPRIGPRTVVWLNEAQFYLDVPDGGPGERVAAGLRELLRDPARAPVLILATLWPQYWDTLTARPPGGADPHAQARDLLAGSDIAVPATFTPAQAAQLAGSQDARLALAARLAADGQVTQFLAGAPELLARYRNAPPAAAALISAAMDARRLGAGAGLPYSFLEAAAPGYLSADQWDGLGEDWLERALAWSAVPCRGARGPLSRIRPRPPAPHAPKPGSPNDSEEPRGGPGAIATEQLYRLADWLDQHGRQHRRYQIPAPEFWAAAAAYVPRADQATLGFAAHDRGLYRAAAQLHKNAAASGSLYSALYLSNPPDCLRTDPRPAHWAAASASLDDLDGVADLLKALREAGADEQAAVLAARAVTGVSLDDPYGVARLLAELREAGAAEQAAALVARDPAAHVSLGDVGSLLYELDWAGADEQAAALAARAATSASLDDALKVGHLLAALGTHRTHEQAAVLAARAAADFALDDPFGVAHLLEVLSRARSTVEQAAALVARDPAAHVSLDDLDGVTALLKALREAGADEQAAALAARAAAGASLHDANSFAVARLLDALPEGKATALAARAAADASLDDPDSIADLLDGMGWARWTAGPTADLAARAAADASLDNPRGVARLLRALRESGADGQAAALVARDPAAHVSLDDPGGVAWLLLVLRRAGADGQAAALVARDPAAHVSLDDLGGVAWLLQELRESGADGQAAALVARYPAADVSLDNPGGVAWLLQELRESGADGQAAVLAARLPGAGMFGLFLKEQTGQDLYWFGREADGSPAEPWGWDDLD